MVSFLFKLIHTSVITVAYFGGGKETQTGGRFIRGGFAPTRANASIFAPNDNRLMADTTVVLLSHRDRKTRVLDFAGCDLIRRPAFAPMLSRRWFLFVLDFVPVQPGRIVYRIVGNMVAAACHTRNGPGC